MTMMDKSSRMIPNRTNITLNLKLNAGQVQSKTPFSFDTVETHRKFILSVIP